MEDVSLILKPKHLLPLREVLRVHYSIIERDENVTDADKAIITDLLKRVELLHNATAAEIIAKNSRIKYHRYVHRRADSVTPAKVTKPTEKPVTGTTTEATETPVEMEPKQITAQDAPKVEVIARPI